MDRNRKLAVTALLALVGAVVALGLTVYPFQYGLVESVAFAAIFVAAGVFQFVLDDASFGG